MLQFKTVMIEFGVAYSEPGAAKRLNTPGEKCWSLLVPLTRHATTDAQDCPLETRNCQWKAAIIAQVISYVQFFAQAAVQNLVRDPFFLMFTRQLPRKTVSGRFQGLSIEAIR